VNTLFSTALFLASVYILGFLAAIPIGASQIEVARRALNGFLVSALIVVAGSVSSDFVYGSIALYGLAPFLQKPMVEAIFWLVNAVLILVFAIVMLRESKPAKEDKSGINLVTVEHSARQQSKLGNLRLAYFTGFSLAFTNPLMIAWWLLAAKFLKDVGIANIMGNTPDLTNTTRVVFLIAGCSGIGSYLSLLAVIIHRRHKLLPQKNLRKITLGFGIAMILFAIYFVIRSVTVLTSPESSNNNIIGSHLKSTEEIHFAKFLYLEPNHLVSLPT
jgi:threonine/homoserine/homoserine lactone efflux protein